MVKVNNINVFMGKKHIIKNVSFQVKPGEIVGIIGPNGAGKTTIMKTILGLLKFTGKVSVADRNVTEDNHRALSKVGALIENPAIYPFLTGLQNLELYTEDKNSMKTVVKQLKMQNYIKSRAKNYSLGMKQKLGIAMALLNNPNFVILDEPMNGLDIESTILVRKLIKHYAEQGTSFLISSHILSELQKIMTRIVIINEGNLIINKNIDDFKNINHSRYKLLTNNQKESQKLLQEKGMLESQSNKYLLVNEKNIFSIQNLLYKNKIQLLELAPQQIDFEQLVVRSLNKKAEEDEI
ncbi:ABC transporter ATP-binding protein [Philodulcilactobacillus myokoensis]|uniref:ABC transporter ATP-binding protein n=1 Tax=Philodulcilactobacillus myokoensis TaxID=2929573 RepID=A0A9W6B205_9LACO|nr:ATP-binding cassette domain-containing protein [Philodulcilactobacillus myokoensis]GLB47336.1 ABC transporter ATP-binding protein [Philodulcilactobacillus myokoensis]